MGLLAAAITVLAVMACQPITTATRPARGGTAVEALIGTASVLNPLFEENDSARDVDSAIYQGLTAVDANQNVVGLLASDWTVSPDHQTYTFTIRSGVRWADGQPFTADDVLFTFHVLQDPEYQEPGADSWRQVGVAAGGPGQVVFSLRSPSASFPLTLRIGIIPKHIFQGMAPADIAASPYSGVRAFGTGPFKVAAMDARAITLNRNPFASQQPYLDYLVMRTYPATDPQQAIRAVRQGVADLVGGLEPQEVDTLQGRSDLAIQDVQTFTESFVAFNPEGAGKAFFSDVKVRQALVQAIDRTRVIAEVLEGRADPNPGPIPVGSWAYAPSAAKKYQYDQLSAARALEGVGWVLGPGAQVRSKGGVPFRTELIVADSFPNHQIADAVARQLSAIGVGVDVKAVAPSVLVQNYLVGRNYEMALVRGDVGRDPDPYSLWHSGADPGTLNFAYSRSWGLIDKDLEDGRYGVDQATRLAAYVDFQELIADQAPAIFLYAPHYDYAVSQRLHGVRFNRVVEPEDRFQYVTEWYVTTQVAS